MTSTVERGPRRSTAGDDRRAVVVGGAVFLFSGVSLVVHLVLGSPLAATVGVAGVIATGAAAAIVWRDAFRPSWVARIRAGAVAGTVATLVYDVTRWMLVQVDGLQVSPFKAWPLFGQALLGAGGGSVGRQIAGIAFHLVNGVAFGIAYTVWFGERGRLWGVGFALALEAFMLALYPGWLDVRSIREFTQVSLLGHLAYGAALGWTARAMLERSRR